MSRIVVVHSSRGDIGKSTIAANVACLCASRGYRVGIIEANLQSPGLQYVFGLQDSGVSVTLNDYLWGRIDIKQAAIDVTSQLEVLREGKIIANPKDARLFVIPSSITIDAITRVQREGYDFGLLNDGFYALVEDLSLDVLIIDTRPGFPEESLFCVAICDYLLLCMRSDTIHYQGTAVLVELGRNIDVPAMAVFVNMVPPQFNHSVVKARIEKTFEIQVAGVLPHMQELMYKHSTAMLALEKPDDLWAQQMQAATDVLMS